MESQGIMRVQLSHDGFARQSLMREKTAAGECAWCGCRRDRLFRYYFESDGDMYGRSRLFIDHKAFCSVGCWRAYAS